MRADSGLLSLWAMRFGAMFASALMMPVLTVWLEPELGVRRYGMLLSVANAATLLGGPAFGRLADAHGRRLGLIACTASNMAGMVLLLTGNLTGTIVFSCAGRIVQSVCNRSLAGLTQAAVKDGPRHMALVRSSVGLGFAIGNALGGLLTTDSATLPLALACAISLVPVVLALVGPQLSAPPAAANGHANGHAESASAWTALAAALKQRRMCAIMLIFHISGFSFHVFTSTWSAALRARMGYSPAQFGYMLAYVGWSFALTNLFVVPSFIALAPETTMLKAALLTAAVGRAVLTGAGVTYHFLIGFLITALGRATAGTLCATLSARAAPRGHRAAILGLGESIFGAAGVYAPFVSAELLERHGPCAPAAASCAAMLVVFAVACAELRASDEGVPKEAPQPRGPVTRRRAKAMKAD